MSTTIWRIVNPALNPPQVGFQSHGDEQEALREFAAREGALRGLKLIKSEDDGKTWVEVEARAPDATPAPADKSDVDTSIDRPKARAHDAAEKSEGSKKAPK